MRSLPWVIGILLLVPALPNAAATTLFSEGWESGMGAWTVTNSGASIVCSGGCSMYLAPPCCSSEVGVTHTLDIPLTGTTTVLVDIMPDALVGDTDADLRVYLDVDGITLSPTDGTSMNNGLHIGTNSDPTGADFASTTISWNHLAIAINADTHTVQAMLLDASGGIKASSSLHAVSASATRIVGLGLDAATWSPGGATGFRYDNIAVQRATTCPFVSASLAAPASVRTGSPEAFSMALSGPTCAALTWTLNFGDGKSSSGTGVPPSSVTHIYTSGGNRTATLTVHEDGLPDSVASVAIHVIAPATQRVTGTTIVTTSLVSYPSADLITLAAISDGTSIMSLDYQGAANLDVTFYDSFGGTMASQPCSHFQVDAREVCLAPANAGYVRVSGTGVAATWTMLYTYYPDA